ncbi:pirin family protein [Bradyrhizobium manausense]|uniref:pirin family protein n=1 Tax=Bradyrhizobium manausense TaxID=989370 RepID=UPI001BABD820|nr:pirin family protein [Bradyrhizobium manausense]MBR0834247.1 pirin family protein [Bradyrhizobium manausense]
MSLRFSPIASARRRNHGGTFSLKAVDLSDLAEAASPVTVLDDFRVHGQPFAPHPHAGISAVTYVFEDSEGNLRSRDSLGNDVVVGPGGLVWTQAGSGVIHHETPADTYELHGLQLLVNLSAKNKLVAPRMLWLRGGDVPEWCNDETSDRVRIVVGSFEGHSSPLVPAEPFTFLDVLLRKAIPFDLPPGHNALVYLVGGAIRLRSGEREQKMAGGHAIALYGGGGCVVIEALSPSHLVILAGPDINDPLVVGGPFIMNEPGQIEAAVARYRSGKMGYLAPL